MWVPPEFNLRMSLSLSNICKKRFRLCLYAYLVPGFWQLPASKFVAKFGFATRLQLMVNFAVAESTQVAPTQRRH